MPTPYILSRLGRHLTLVDHGVDEAVFSRALCAHEVVTLGVALDGFEALTGVMRQQRVQAVTDVQDFLGMDVDVRRLPWKPPSGW